MKATASSTESKVDVQLEPSAATDAGRPSRHRSDRSSADDASRYSTRVLVLGLGNDVLTDDAVGLQVARRLAVACAGREGVAVRESMEMGLALLDEIVGCEHLVLVDAIVTGRHPPGFLHEFGAEQLTTRRTCAPHFVGVTETLALGAKLELAMPRDVRIFAIEVDDPFTLGAELSPDVAESVDPATARIATHVKSVCGETPRIGS